MWKTNRCAERGTTALELIISTAIGALVLAVLFVMFLPAAEATSANSAKADTVLPGSIAFHVLESDVRVTDSRSLTVGAGAASAPATLGSGAETTVLVVPSSQDFTVDGHSANDYHGRYFYVPGSGAPLWRSYVVWALEPTNCQSTGVICNLYRTTVPIPTPGGIFVSTPITSVQLGNVLSTIATTGTLIAANVSSFQIAVTQYSNPCTPTPCIGFNPEVQIQLATRSTDEQNNVSESAYQTQVFVRN